MSWPAHIQAHTQPHTQPHTHSHTHTHTHTHMCTYDISDNGGGVAEQQAAAATEVWHWQRMDIADSVPQHKHVWRPFHSP